MKWEYKTVIISGNIRTGKQSKLEEVLNKQGEEGWELVNIIPQVGSDTDCSYGDVDINISCCEEVYVENNVCVFKRCKENSDYIE